MFKTRSHRFKKSGGCRHVIHGHMTSHATSCGDLGLVMARLVTWLVVRPVATGHGTTSHGDLRLVIQSVAAICNWSCAYLWLLLWLIYGISQPAVGPVVKAIIVCDSNGRSSKNLETSRSLAKSPTIMWLGLYYPTKAPTNTQNVHPLCTRTEKEAINIGLEGPTGLKYKPSYLFFFLLFFLSPEGRCTWMTENAVMWTIPTIFSVSKWCLLSATSQSHC